MMKKIMTIFLAAGIAVSLTACGGLGNVDARECIETMNSIILQFFDYYLKGQGELSIAPKY